MDTQRRRYPRRNHSWFLTATPNAKWRNGVCIDEEARERFQGPPVRTLADMSEREIKALEREYGCPVVRPQTRARRKKRSN